jgi:hypothetical protein
MFDRLPIEARLIVLQLLIWKPNDARLLWLLGEALNANQEILGALNIFDELVSSRGLSDIQAVREHRNELRKARDVLHELLNLEGKRPFLAQEMLSAFRPRGGPASPGLGDAMVAGTGLMGPVYWVEFLDQTPGRPTPPIVPPPPFVLEWRQIIVAFVFGLFTAVLVRAQVQEWRRRGVGLISHAEPAPRETPPSSEEPVASGSSGKSELAP